MKHQKGFTLVELLVALGLVGIIISVVMSFFITNIKSYEAINIDSELQYQSQYIINFMTNKILESKKIVSINRVNSNLSNTTETGISYISFQYGTDDTICHNFEINSNKEILYKDGAVGVTADKVFGNHVEELKITPISSSFEHTKSIEIYLKLQNGSKSYEAKQKVLMRNAE